MSELFVSFLPFLGIGLGVFFFLTLVVSLFLRRVVPTNEVHIVQSAKKTISYGKGLTAGNTYYEWPYFLPLLGVNKVVLPVSNFNISLQDYEGYDSGRLPFVVDVMAFFRIADSETAAQRVSHFRELIAQLQAVVQGAVRSILAAHPIEEIMQGRSQFGDLFTREVQGQLLSWGVEPVKNIELMDLRDSQGSRVIHQIMEKKKSEIEAQSRVAVAENTRVARLAEIESERSQELAAQDAKRAVGEREIAVGLQLGTQREQAAQTISEQRKISTDKDMAVQQVTAVRGAEIQREVQVVAAEQARQTRTIGAEAQRATSVIEAEGEKQQLTLRAEGQLEAKRREAEGIQLEGTAKAEAAKAMQLAPVHAQIELAREIGGNQGYQTYLLTIRRIEADQAVGIAQASALTSADIKVIATSDNASAGLNDAGSLLSAKGGAQIGAMMEALRNNPTAGQVLDRVLTAAPKNGKASEAHTQNGL